jgi:hypothetical protein
LEFLFIVCIFQKLVQRFETLKTAQLGTADVRPPWRTMQSEATTISYTMLLLLSETAKLGMRKKGRKDTTEWGWSYTGPKFQIPGYKAQVPRDLYSRALRKSQ